MRIGLFNIIENPFMPEDKFVICIPNNIVLHPNQNTVENVNRIIAEITASVPGDQTQTFKPPDCSRCGEQNLQNFFTGKDTGRIVCTKCKDEMVAAGVAK